MRITPLLRIAAQGLLVGTEPVAGTVAGMIDPWPQLVPIMEPYVRDAGTLFGHVAPSTGANNGSVPQDALNRERILERLNPLPLLGT